MDGRRFIMQFGISMLQLSTGVSLVFRFTTVANFLLNVNADARIKTNDGFTAYAVANQIGKSVNNKMI